MDWLEIAKAFASPLATVIGAAAAVAVTWRIGRQQLQLSRQQAQIAQAQRDIAFDKLKQDLFEKRYEIYSAARRIMKHLLDDFVIGRVVDPEMDALWEKLDEAVFFFPPEAVDQFLRIRALATELHKNTHQGPKDASESDGETLRQIAELYDAFPSVMRGTMEFSRLTSPT